jgi:hypothetical protein
MTHRLADDPDFPSRDEAVIQCPKCGSANWRCYDEQTKSCWDADGREIVSFPVGYLVCNDCTHDWIDVPALPIIGDDCDCDEY